ncbi:MAG: hypothetical protein LBM16_05480 [Clostridiales bacterium]|jgi:hypothetical protein|nr:hypothetical protein [Clostridiales bacterium]
MGKISNGIFRKSSIERIESPDRLNDVAKGVGSGLWTALAALVMFVIGACVWAFFGNIPETVSAIGKVDAGFVVVELDYAQAQTGMSAKVSPDYATDKSFVGEVVEQKVLDGGRQIVSIQLQPWASILNGAQCTVTITKSDRKPYTLFFGGDF